MIKRFLSSGFSTRDSHHEAISIWSLLKLLIPILAVSVSAMLLPTIAGIYIARLGTDALAVFGLSFSVFAIASVFLGNLGSSIDHFAARHSESGQNSELGKLRTIYYAIVTLLSFAFLGLGLAAFNFLLPRLSLNHEQTYEALAFCALLFASAIFSSWFNVDRQILQVYGFGWYVFLIVAAGTLIFWLFADWRSTEMIYFGDGSLFIFGLALLVTRGLMSLASMTALRLLVGLKLFCVVTFSDAVSVLRFGAPAGLAGVAEVGAISAYTYIALRYGAAGVAAHEIVLNIATLTFMLPSALGSVGAIWVGRLMTQDTPTLLQAASRKIILISVLSASFVGVFIACLSHDIIAIWSDDLHVLTLAIPALLVFCSLQVFDWLQVVLAGCCRGAGDTKYAMFGNIVGHWVAGIPLCYFVLLPAVGGIAALWLGVLLGVAFTSLVLWFRLKELLPV